MIGYAQDVAPADALAVWGARTILEGGTFGLVHDRQSLIGEGVERVNLLERLNCGILREAQETVRELLRDGTMRSSEAGAFILHHDDRVIVYGNTNGSHGYLYLTAWLGPWNPKKKED